MKVGKEYYALTLQVTEHGDTIECLVQEGTGNTTKTSKLVTRYFPLNRIKRVITNPITVEGYVRQFFKLKIIIIGKIKKFRFSSIEETDELNSLFEKPDYFKNLDVSHLYDKE